MYDIEKPAWNGDSFPKGDALQCVETHRYFGRGFPADGAPWKKFAFDVQAFQVIWL